MKFDTIIIGGGLAGLTAGIRLLRAGQRVAIVSAGQSALHFCSGSFELLGEAGAPGKESVEDAMAKLPVGHPYRKVGYERVRKILGEVKPFFAKAGIELSGEPEKANYRLTPIGLFRPAWMTLSDHLTVENPDKLPFRKAAIINVRGYLDFYPHFIASGLRKHGVDIIEGTFDTDGIDHLRKSSTEMRSTTIARVITRGQIDTIARRFNEKSQGCDAILAPAVLGIYGPEDVAVLREKVDKPVWLVPTIPANVPGVRTQLMLAGEFKSHGGVLFLGDTVVKGTVKGRRIESVSTYNLGDTAISADNYILACGSFFSHGIEANMERVYEPIFGLDVNAPADRTKWYDKDLYAPQPYMTYGLITDNAFHPSLKGETIDNAYAVGALAGGVDHLKEQSGAGTSIVSAIYVADKILKS